MLFRLIPAAWAKLENNLNEVIEDVIEPSQIDELNKKGYNIYWYPNYPSTKPSSYTQAKDIDTFSYVFVDMDLKENKYKTKEEFVEKLQSCKYPPTSIVDSGNGVHAYWEVSDLEAMSFLRLNRRLCRHFKTDEAVSKLNQLMRLPETYNVKSKDFKLCKVIGGTDRVHTCEELDSFIQVITIEDEEYCKNHFNSSYGLEDYSPDNFKDESLPGRFFVLLKENKEIAKLYSGMVKDRSAGDFRLAHLLLANEYTKDEATVILMNSAKAIERSPKHRLSYAKNIIDKVWIGITEVKKSSISSTIFDILKRNPNNDEEFKFPCSELVDSTVHGFRRGEVLGLIGGTSSGKTAFSLNFFHWFLERNPDFIHLFVALEQEDIDIATRWTNLAGFDPIKNSSVRVLTNYNEDRTKRNLSLNDIKDHVKFLELEYNKKVGCVVIDHIGILKPSTRESEREGLIGICTEMKAFAVETKTFLIMQSQTCREKAGDYNDLELGVGAAYGTSTFENFCDYIVTTWQPIKLCHEKTVASGKPLLITAFKFCKLREMNTIRDNIKRDAIYLLYFEQETGKLREMLPEEYISYEFWDLQATNIRNRDRKLKSRKITKITWTNNKSL